MSEPLALNHRTLGLLAHLPPSLRAVAPDLIEEGRQQYRARAEEPPPFGVSLAVEDAADVAARLERQLAGRKRRRELAVARWEQLVPPRWQGQRLRFPDDDPTGEIRRYLKDPTCNLHLWGADMGTGKSRTACLIGTHLVLELGKWVVRHGAPALNEKLNPQGDPRDLEDVLTCDVLIIDEMGSERISEWTAERWSLVINTRWENQLPVIVTTNLDWPAMCARYDERLTERLADDAMVIHFPGESHRNPFARATG